MKYFLVISMLCSILVISVAYPAGGDAVEIEKQRLIKFPEETFQYQTSKQSEETRRILEEINKININLGYVKKPEQPPQMPTILDSEQYLYPRPAYHPSIHGVALPASIRSLRFNRPIKHVGRFHGHSAYSPTLQYARDSAYYYPNLYLNVPEENSKPRNFHGKFRAEFDIEEPTDYRNDDQAFQLYSPKKYQKFNNMYKIQLVGDFRQIMAALQANHNKMNKANSNHDAGKSVLPLIFLPANLKSYDQLNNELKARTAAYTEQATVEKQRKNTKIKEIVRPVSNINTQLTPNDFQRSSNKTVLINKESTPESQLKGKLPFGFFNKPALPGVTNSPAVTPTSSVSKVTVQNLTDNSTGLKEVADDYDSNEESAENAEQVEKNLFAAFQRDRESAQKLAHNKDGGIIIQRLKVRKGGIAIAGPGGVATAGSGGTAIVGPGGFALTHPRSLTIAGPGAKVVSYPESFNLGDAALKTSQGNLPEGGEIVATGPIVYYNSPVTK